MSTKRSLIQALAISLFFSVYSQCLPADFSLPISYATPDSASGVCSADINKDGWPDLAVTNKASNQVTILLNNGDGTFQIDVSYSVGDNPLYIACAYLNGDDYPDLISANSESNSISILINDGTGSFLPSLAYSVGALPLSVFPADFNNDNIVDIAVTNYQANNISVLFGNGDGTFNFDNTYQVGSLPRSIVAADIDGDYDKDVVVANAGTNLISVLFNNGSGSFGSRTDYLTGLYPHSVLLLDINGDTNLDIASADYYDNEISILRNNGDGTFQNRIFYSTGVHPKSIADFDFNLDGWVDIVSVNDNSITVLKNNGAGQFTETTAYPLPQYATSAITPDIDQDNDPDIAVAAYTTGNIYVLLNLHYPQIIESIPGQNSTNIPMESDISVSFDINMNDASINDTTLIVYGNMAGYYQGTISYEAQGRTAIFDPYNEFIPGELVTVILTDDVVSSSGSKLNKGYVWSFSVAATGGTGVFTSSSQLEIGQYPYSITAANFNNDQYIDIAAAINLDPGYSSLIMNNGNGTFGPYSQYSVARQPISILSADFDKDGYIDIVSATSSSNSISVQYNNGDGTFSGFSTYQTGNNPFSVITTDFSGDGKLDLSVGNDGGQSISIFINDGDGTFAPQFVYPNGTAVWCVYPADLDNDYDIDFIASNGYTLDISIYRNNGDGTFYRSNTIDMDGQIVGVHSADLNADGNMDIIAGNTSINTVSVVLNNGDNTFTDPVNYSVGANPYSLTSGDLDDNGYPDIVSVSMQSNSVSILLNNGDGTLMDNITYAVGEYPRSVIAADFDGDGDVDLATANVHSEDVSILINTGHHPFILGVIIDEDIESQHIINHLPVIEWDYYISDETPQVQFEIAVGTDDDWTYAEMWNPAPFQSSDTFVVYNGSPLVDGDTYYLRLRVNNGLIWSEWYETTFRMNSVPSLPVPVEPINDTLVLTDLPFLVISSASEPEGDILSYDFQYVNDTMHEPILITITDVADTAVQVSGPLFDNCRYFWSARSFDGYEYSDWSGSGSFWVNSANQAPGNFQALEPPGESQQPVYNMLPAFSWTMAMDDDPFDSIYYDLIIAADANFNFALTIDSIWAEEYTVTDSLEFGEQYWWKVRAFDNYGLNTYSDNIRDFKTWKLGDVNANWTVDILDIVYLVNFKFKGGPAPTPMYSGDMDGNCTINILDIVYLVNYKFKTGPEPEVGCE